MIVCFSSYQRKSEVRITKNTLKGTRMNFFKYFLLVTLIPLSIACGKKDTTAPEGAPSDPMADKGVGPISSVDIGPLNPQKAEQGGDLFKAKCSGCHKIAERYVGPALIGVTKKQSPEWIMNMILNPAEMTQKDPIAKELLATHYTQMTFQNVTQDEARLILEFFRQNDANQP